MAPECARGKHSAHSFAISPSRIPEPRLVQQMPVISIDALLASLPDLVRARQVLLFLLHFYVHSLPPSSGSEGVRIPKALAIPVLEISYALDMPPALTYADTTYYNYELHEENGIRALDLFTGSSDEAHFYVTTVEIEQEGQKAMTVMLEIISVLSDPALTDKNEEERLAGLLRSLAASISEMVRILDVVRDGCAPSVFYNDIRPWYVGSKEEGDGKWVFDVGPVADDVEKRLEGNRWVQRGKEGAWVARAMAGSTAAQSAIVQAVDVFLGIEGLTHERGGLGTNAAIDRGGYGGSGERGNFLTKMRAYLPLAHRKFIETLGDKAQGLREHAERSEVAREAYNEAVLALKEFRTVHVRIATLYIVSQARKAIGAEVSEGVKGTGGTELVPFLKGVRDRTGQGALIGTE